MNTQNDSSNIIITTFEKKLTGLEYNTQPPMRPDARTEFNNCICFDTSNQRIGINSASPQSSLVVEGNARIDGSLTVTNLITAQDISTIDISCSNIDLIGNMDVSGYIQAIPPLVNPNLNYYITKSIVQQSQPPIKFLDPVDIIWDYDTFLNVQRDAGTVDFSYITYDEMWKSLNSSTYQRNSKVTLELLFSNQPVLPTPPSWDNSFSLHDEFGPSPDGSNNILEINIHNVTDASLNKWLGIQFAFPLTLHSIKAKDPLSYAIVMPFFQKKKNDRFLQILINISDNQYIHFNGIYELRAWSKTEVAAAHDHKLILTRRNDLSANTNISYTNITFINPTWEMPGTWTIPPSDYDYPGYQGSANPSIYYWSLGISYDQHLPTKYNNTMWAISPIPTASSIIVGQDPLLFNQLAPSFNSSSFYAKLDGSNIFTESNTFMNQTTFYNDISFIQCNIDISSIVSFQTNTSTQFDTSINVVQDISFQPINYSITISNILDVSNQSDNSLATLHIYRDQSGIILDTVFNKHDFSNIKIQMHEDKLIFNHKKQIDIGVCRHCKGEWIPALTLTELSGMTMNTNIKLNGRHISGVNEITFSDHPSQYIKSPNTQPPRTPVIDLHNIYVQNLECDYLTICGEVTDLSYNLYIPLKQSQYSQDISWGVWTISDTHFKPLLYCTSGPYKNTLGYYIAQSDQKFKTNIRPFKRKLDIINKLNPVYFTWKESGNNDYGFIAQELQAIIPGIIEDQYDSNKKITKVYSINYQTHFFAVLIKAIQDLDSDKNTIINLLENEVVELENDNKFITNQVEDIIDRIQRLKDLT